jgi:cell division protein FtsA
VKFGSAWPGENKDNEIVSIPGLRGRAKRDFIEKLIKIIHARVVEIVEQVFTEIKHTHHHEDPRKKLIAGIVPTGRQKIKTHKAISRVYYGGAAQ